MGDFDEAARPIRREDNHCGRCRDGGPQRGHHLRVLWLRAAYVRLEARPGDGTGAGNPLGRPVPWLSLPPLSALGGGDCPFYRTFCRVMI